MEEALQAAAEATGGDLTIEQLTKLHNDQVCLVPFDKGEGITCSLRLACDGLRGGKITH